MAERTYYDPYAQRHWPLQRMEDAPAEVRWCARCVHGQQLGVVVIANSTALEARLCGATAPIPVAGVPWLTVDAMPPAVSAWWNEQITDRIGEEPVAEIPQCPGFVPATVDGGGDG